jgi:hypothetical protein
MKKAVKPLGKSLKGNENSFKMIALSKLLRDEHGSKDFDNENDLKERKNKNQFYDETF